MQRPTRRAVLLLIGLVLGFPTASLAQEGQLCLLLVVEESVAQVPGLKTDLALQMKTHGLVGAQAPKVTSYSFAVAKERYYCQQVLGLRRSDLPLVCSARLDRRGVPAEILQRAAYGADFSAVMQSLLGGR